MSVGCLSGWCHIGVSVGCVGRCKQSVICVSKVCQQRVWVGVSAHLMSGEGKRRSDPRDSRDGVCSDAL